MEQNDKNLKMREGLKAYQDKILSGEIKKEKTLDPIQKAKKYPIGWFKLYRKVIENGIMNKPPLHFKLWIWMLCQAKHHNSDGLSKGQFKTSIKEMQDAMSYYIGYRKIVPTIKEIRGAYEGFAKDGMAGISKGRLKMVITIINFNKLQG
jgi:hypothetical protein